MSKLVLPEHTRDQVDAAGRVLAKTRRPDETSDEWNRALGVIGNWRSSHAHPLLTMRMTLRGRSDNVDPEVIIAQGLKRLSSIRAKLQRMRKLTLSEMQDIGGCRAVVSTSEQVFELARFYAQGDAKNPHRGSKPLWKNDYITNPKSSGYRSYHIIY